MKVFISACLYGWNVRYDGQNKIWQEFLDICSANQIKLIPFCPEDFSLSTPREPAWLVGGDGKDFWQNKARVLNAKRKDLSNEFRIAAQECLRQIQQENGKVMILKQNSPSCGNKFTYQELNNNKSQLKSGLGVTAALLESNGIKTFSEEDDLRQILEYIKNHC